MAPHSRPAPLTLPAPEELGITSALPAAAAFDWTAVHRRFREAGATCFHVEQMPEGSWRLVGLVPTGKANQSHHVEAHAASEAEAARLALARLDEWTLHGK